jgi:23S rRNA (cytosine1962-C5)-methyltransferase
MLESTLNTAFTLRESLGAFQESEALRVFYGPGESTDPSLSQLAIDVFKDQAWITQWAPVPDPVLKEVVRVLRQKLPLRSVGIVLMDRSKVASEADSIVLDGEVREGKFIVKEFGIPYLVQMRDTKHPGLFLDHAPLRRWLIRTQQGKRVLNLFAYTGALSVAAGAGSASSVTTLDLSKPTIEWARENWEQAGLKGPTGDFIYGDVFDWLPRLKKKGLEYDTILCDPPSFSRTKTGAFSTGKDLARLHALILPLLAKNGILVTSINSENISERAFLGEVETAARQTGTRLQCLGRVDLPESFPTPLDPKLRYLKGFYLRSV